MYTAGVVGGLTLTAACAPSERFLHWGGPLSLGLGVVFVASIGEFCHHYCVGRIIVVGRVLLHSHLHDMTLVYVAVGWGYILENKYRFINMITDNHLLGSSNSYMH